MPRKTCAEVRGAVHLFNSYYLVAVHFAPETRSGFANGR